MPTASDEFNLPLYQDPERYDAEHWWKVDDLQFWKQLAMDFGPQVLELAAGTGRLALAVLETDCRYTGLEISAPFIKQAEQKLETFGDRARLVHGDIRDFQLDEQFDLIYIGFNSFLHLLTDADALAALRCIRAHCHPQTRFAIDIFVPDPLFLYRPAGYRAPAMEYTDPASGEQIKVTETNDYDPLTEVNHISWYYSTAERADFLQYNFTMRMYFPDTMDRLLHDAGFQVLEKWGNYQHTAFDDESSLQLYLARVKPQGS